MVFNWTIPMARTDLSQAKSQRRVGSLDGLRGIAALIVVFHHVVLASSPPLAEAYRRHTSYRTGSLNWIFSRTPLHVVWAGPEMVLVFFVLSGYVLALPAVARGRRWFDASYYPRRLIRLFLPVWAALLFGVLLHELHTHSVAGGSWWLNSHAGPVSAVAAARNATLLSQGSTWAFTTVIWSLSSEVWFSVFLPIVLVAAIYIAASRWLNWLAVIVCLAVMFVGSGGLPRLDGVPGSAQWLPLMRWLPVFVLGSLMAFNHHSLPRIPSRLAPLALLASICLLTSSYMLSGTGSSDAIGTQFILDALGAIGLVWVALASASFSSTLTHRPLRWLGSRSFSLYLVHEPIVVAFGFWFARQHSVPLLLVVAVPVSLLVAELFWRQIESRSLRLARNVGNRCRERFSRLDAAAALTLQDRTDQSSPQLDG